MFKLWQNAETSVLTNKCRGRLSNEALIGGSSEISTRVSFGWSSGLLVQSDSTLETLGLGRGPGVKYVEMLIFGSSVFPSARLCDVISPINKNYEKKKQ